MADIAEPGMAAEVAETISKPAASYLRYLNPFETLELRPWMTTAGIVTATAASSAALYMLYKRRQKGTSYTNISDMKDVLDAQHDVRPRIPKALSPIQRMGNRIHGRDSLNCLDSVGDRAGSCKPPKIQGGQIMLNLEHGGQVLLDPSLSQKPPTEGWARPVQATHTYPDVYNGTGSM